MENIRKLVVDTVEQTYESIVKNDEEFLKLESENNEIISKLKAQLANDDYRELERLLLLLRRTKFHYCNGF